MTDFIICKKLRATEIALHRIVMGYVCVYTNSELIDFNGTLDSLVFTSFFKACFENLKKMGRVFKICLSLSCILKIIWFHF